MLFERIDEVAKALESQGLDGWLLYDFRGLNPLAQTLLGLSPEALCTRRLAACFTADGRVRVLEHAIERDVIGSEHATRIERQVYLSRDSFREGIGWLSEGCQRIAAEYCPDAQNPYLSFVDAGTVELLRRYVDDVVSSGDLIQQFQAIWTEAQWQSHTEAAAITTAAFPIVWKFIADKVRNDGSVSEREVERVILDHFADHMLLPGHPPIVARGRNSGLPHYETGTGDDATIKQGDLVLVDLWGRLDRPDTIYSDLTRMGYVGEDVAPRYEQVFQVAVSARDAAIGLLRDRFAEGTGVLGWEVDRACRNVIEDSGYGTYFTHRTGHSITTELHGSGAHMDDLETKETRRVLPGTGFSIEPGIYMPDLAEGGFGVRTEVNVFVGHDSTVHVTGGPLQTSIEPILRPEIGNAGGS